MTHLYLQFIDLCQATFSGFMLISYVNIAYTITNIIAADVISYTYKLVSLSALLTTSGFSSNETGLCAHISHYTTLVMHVGIVI